VTPVIKKDNRDDGWIVTLVGKHKLNPKLEASRGKVWVFHAYPVVTYTC